MRTNSWVALWLCGFAVGCGANQQAAAPDVALIPVPGCEAIDHTPCDVRQTPCQVRLLALAACLRGDEPGALPIITLMTKAQFSARVAAQLSAQQPDEHLAQWEWALTELGLLQPGGLSPETMLTEAVSFVAGLYDSDTKEILIVDRGDDVSDTSGSIILVHEFIHALQDRHMDLSAFVRTHALTSDSSLAARSIVEGEARLHEARYSASALGHDPNQIDWKRRFQNAVTMDEMFLVSADSPYTAGRRNFPYNWGARYLQLVWAAGGLAAIRSRFASPPTTSRTLMASVAEAVADVSAVLPQTELAARPPDGWNPVIKTTLGAWGTFLMLAHAASGPGADRFRELALAWRGDSLSIYDDPSHSPALVWRLAFVDETVAQTVAQYAALTLGTANVHQVSTEVIITRRSGGLPVGWASPP